MRTNAILRYVYADLLKRQTDILHMYKLLWYCIWMSRFIHGIPDHVHVFTQIKAEKETIGGWSNCNVLLVLKTYRCINLVIREIRRNK